MFEKNGQSQNNNGKRLTSEDALKEGAEILLGLLSDEKNPVILSKQQAVDIFVKLQGVRIPKEAGDILDKVSHHEIHYGGEGYIYLEKVRGKIALGYSPYK